MRYDSLVITEVCLFTKTSAMISHPLLNLDGKLNFDILGSNDILFQFFVDMFGYAELVGASDWITGKLLVD